MLMQEIVGKEDRVLIDLLMDYAWRDLTRKVVKKYPAPKGRIAKPRVLKKPKRAPYAAKPKPLPKPKSLPLTPSQINQKQQKSQQDYAQAVKRAMLKKQSTVMPKSIQPVSGNIVSPISAVNPEFEKKMQSAKLQGEQNRDYESKPHFPE